jgi:hypothetical protein
VLSRRDVLRLAGVTAGAGALAACTSSGSGGQSPSPGGSDDPDAALRAEVAAQETALLDLYAATASGLTGTAAARLTALGSRHRDYRAAVLPSSWSASATGSSSGSGSPSSSTTGGATAPATVRGVREAETRAAGQRVAQAGRARDPELARVLVLAAAGAAGAAEVLKGWTS